MTRTAANNNNNNTSKLLKKWLKQSIADSFSSDRLIVAALKCFVTSKQHPYCFYSKDINPVTFYCITAWVTCRRKHKDELSDLKARSQQFLKQKHLVANSVESLLEAGSKSAQSFCAKFNLSELWNVNNNPSWQSWALCGRRAGESKMEELL